MISEEFNVKSTITLRNLVVFSILTIVNLSQSFAQITESPQTVTVDGRLFQAGTESDPLLDSSVDLKVQILNPAKSCILYEEQHNISTLATGGYFNIQVGSAVGDPKRTALDSANSMAGVFYNRTTVINGQTSGGGGCTYTPASEDVRHFRFFVTPSTVGTTEQLSPDMRLDSVPQALVAQTLQGLGKDDVFHTSVTSTQAKLDNLLTTNYSNITDLIGGTSAMYLRNAATGTLLPTRPNDPSSPAAGQLWYDTTSNEIKYYNGTTVQAVGAAGAGISSLTAGSGLSGGTITTSGTISIAAGGVTNAMLASGIDASKITTGTLPVGVVPTNTDTTKLPLAGGTMTGAITMGAATTFGGFDLLGTGHITMNSQKTITIGRYTGAQETTLVSTLIGANAGATWYNSTTNKLMYWNGSAALELAETTTAGGDITAVNTNVGSGLTGGATSGPITLAINVDNNTVEIATNTVQVKDGGITNAKIASMNITKLTSGAGDYFAYMPAGTECATGEVLKWNATTDRWLCDTDATGVSAHSALSGLTAGDDHTQYVLLAGRSGGQNLRGGTASGEDITIESTSHATKGDVILQPTSGNVGIGTTAPTSILDVNGHAHFRNNIYLGSGTAYISNPASAINFATNGSSRMYLSSSGNLHIGTNTQAANKLDISGAAVIGSSYATVATAPTNGLLVEGSVGVGTTTPSTVLDVVGAITSRPYGTATGETGQFIMRELAAGGTETARIRAPDAITTSYALTLPTSAGSSGQVLRTDGTGVLTWVDANSSIAADSLDFSHLADSMTLDASTDISVTGTNNLAITNTGTSSSFRVNDDTADTTPFIIDADGRVGIYTTTPSAKLHIGASPASRGFTLDPGSNTAPTYAGLIVTNSSGAFSTGIGDVGFYAGDSNGIYFLAGTGGRSIRFSILPSGNIGIGTKDPISLQDVSSVTGAISTLSRNDTTAVANDTIGKLQFWNNDTDLTTQNIFGNIEMQAASTVSTDAAAGEMIFRTTGATVAGAPVERMRIASTGNVGIGTTNPLAKLDVNGAQNIREIASASAPTPAAGSTFIYADDSSHSLKVSYNGAGYVDLLTTSMGAPLVSAGNGTAGAPSIGFSADTDTGFYSPGADTIGITLGGTERFQATTTSLGSVTTGGGQITSGTSAGAPGLSFNGDADTGWFRPAADTMAAATGGTEKMRISSTGEVGIGTNNPSHLLHVHSSTTTASGLIKSDTAGAALALDGVNNTNRQLTFRTSGSERWRLTTDNNETGASNVGTDLKFNAFSDAGAFLGTRMTVERGTGNVGIGTTSPQRPLDVVGTIRSSGTTAPSLSLVPTSGSSYVVGSNITVAGVGIYDSTASSWRMVVKDTTGMMGVGTTDPVSVMDASTSTGGILTLSRADITANANDTIGRLDFWNNDTELTTQKIYGNIEVQSAATTSTDAAAGNMIFRTTGSTVTGSPVERMRIDSSGNVGVGTTAPMAPLHIYNSVNSTRYIKVGNVANPTSPAAAGGIFVDNNGGGGFYASDSTAGAHGKYDFWSGVFNFGSATNHAVSIQTNNADRIRITGAGNIGIGTTTIATNTKLDVIGQIRTPAAVVTTNALTFATGNTVSTNHDCATAMTLANIRDGGNYTVVVTGTGTTMCTFSTTTTGDDANTVTYMFQPANAVRTASSHTVYSLMRVGNVVYVSWITGFQ